MVMFHRPNARCHSGKYTPNHHPQIAANYPRLSEFQQRCLQFEPDGHFQNAWVRKVVFSDSVIQWGSGAVIQWGSGEDMALAVYSQGMVRLVRCQAP